MLNQVSSRPGKLYYGNPTVVAVLCALDRHGPNLMSVAWNMPVSTSPPLFAAAIAPSRHSNQLIRDSEEFSVSFLDFGMASTIVGLGRTSGRDLNKATALGLRFQKSERISTPLLLDAYAGYECKLELIIPTGDHEMFVGAVQTVHWNDSAFRNGEVVWHEMRPALYLGANRFLAPLPLPEVSIDSASVARAVRAQSAASIGPSSDPPNQQHNQQRQED